jgi:hypothetical protein
MVRSEVYRARKFEGKMDPDAVRSRFSALKEDMVEQTLQRQSELVSLEKDLKNQIIEPQGVSTILIPQYLNVGRQLWSLSGRFTGATFQNEATLIAQKWVSRGLEKDIVNLILVYFGVSPLA